MDNRLYVGNFALSATEQTLRDAFAKSGPANDVHIVTDRESGQARGVAFVTMGNAQEPAPAIGATDGASLDARALRVNEADGGSGGGRLWPPKQRVSPSAQTNSMDSPEGGPGGRA